MSAPECPANADAEVFADRFTAGDLPFMDALGETILLAPEDSPVAKAAEMGSAYQGKAGDKGVVVRVGLCCFGR